MNIHAYMYCISSNSDTQSKLRTLQTQLTLALAAIKDFTISLKPLADAM